MAILMGIRASEITNRIVREVDDGGRVLWISRAKTPKGNRHLKVPTVLQRRLLALCARREPDERLFGEGRDRHWVYYHVQRICRLAKVPAVCTQGLRETHFSGIGTGRSCDCVPRWQLRCLEFGADLSRRRQET
jgi:integrase